MTFSLLTCIVSPHQLPIWHEVGRLLGPDSVRYIYSEFSHNERLSLGWDGTITTPNRCLAEKSKEATKWIEDAEILLCGLRNVGVIESRARRRLKSYYMSERWLKPPIGIFRLLLPKYFLMARKFIGLLRDCCEVKYLPIGVHAAKDMARLCGLFAGDLKCLFRAPELDFENKPGGKIWLKNGGNGKKYCLDKMRMWGYFVAPSQLLNSQLPHSPTPNSPTIKVLWVGRLLKLKRVDTIIRAVGELSKSHSPTHLLPHSQLTLDIYGSGPEENRLKKLAAKYGDCIKFHPSVHIDEVRKLMREHDIYVLASNGYEGWGAVVSEALEEGMNVIGTFEAGASATMLPKEQLFNAGDWRRLTQLLGNDISKVSIGNWTAANAAKELMMI